MYSEVQRTTEQRAWEHFLHCAEDIPHYQRLKNQVATWQDLPILEKAYLRKHLQDFILPQALQGQDCLVEHTSGSTGIPLVLYRKRQEVWQAARQLWKRRKEIFPDVMQVKGLQVSAGREIQGEYAHDHSWMISPFDLNWQALPQKFEQINALKPRWIRGHPAVLALLAEGLKRHRCKLSFRPVFIECNSGPLHQDVRLLLSEVFDCPVVNHYGTRETYTIAYECPNQQLHVVEESVHAEILPFQSQTGGAGSVVVTSLNFRTMPFIRYQTGDLGRLQNTTCTCGQNGMVMQSLEGRSSDLIEGTALIGTYVFHAVITCLLRQGFKEIVQYQVAEEAPLHFCVRWVLADATQLLELKQAFLQETRRYLPTAHFRFERVEQLLPSAAGKLSFFHKSHQEQHDQG